MSQLAIRNALLTKVLDSTSVTVAFENDSFDPSGLSEWIQFIYNPITSESLGKTVNSSDDERGFIQLNVYIKQGSSTFDNRQLAIIDELKQAFYNGVVIDDFVYVQEVTNSSIIMDSGWCMRAVTINYSTYIKRGT